ncbi:MAG: hypothetical protein IJ213_05015 [Bacteroidales bacterium]|nr:hypothetical protein [Bacteroidales bacterium]
MKTHSYKKVYYLFYCLLFFVVVLSSCKKKESVIEEPIIEKKDTMTEITGEVKEMNKTINFAEVYLMPFFDTVIDVSIIDDAIAVANAEKEIKTLEKMIAKYPNTNYGFWLENYHKVIKTLEDRHNISADEIVKMAKHWIDTITYNPNTICFTTDSVGHFSQKIKSGEYLLLVFGNMEYYPEECGFVFRKRANLKQVNIGAEGLKLNLLLSTIIINRENGDIKRVGIFR